MSGRVSLPMYAAPPDAVEALWRGLRASMVHEGFDPDLVLSHPDDLDAHWRDPNLLLSQTCGFPLTTSLKGHVSYVATPCYCAPGCTGASYSSAFVVRADDPACNMASLRGRRAAFNARDSQSGYNSLRALVAPLAAGGRFFGSVVETGAHRLSVAAVRTCDADVAAIDAVTLALLTRDHPDEVAGLRVLGFTSPTPGLPLITAAGVSGDDMTRLRRALDTVCADPNLSVARHRLLLDGFEVLPVSAYDVIPAMHDLALAAGYPDLA